MQDPADPGASKNAAEAAARQSGDVGFHGPIAPMTASVPYRA